MQTSRLHNRIEKPERQPWGAFNNYVDKMRGGGGQKMSVFVHAQGIKAVHARGGGAKNGKNSVHVVVECPLKAKPCWALTTQLFPLGNLWN